MFSWHHSKSKFFKELVQYSSSLLMVLLFLPPPILLLDLLAPIRWLLLVYSYIQILHKQNLSSENSLTKSSHKSTTVESSRENPVSGPWLISAVALNRPVGRLHLQSWCSGGGWERPVHAGAASHGGLKLNINQWWKESQNIPLRWQSSYCADAWLYWHQNLENNLEVQSNHNEATCLFEKVEETWMGVNKRSLKQKTPTSVCK